MPNLRKPEADNEALARFIMRLLFCLFADSVGLLPDNIFRKMIEADRQEPRKFVRKLKNLFRRHGRRRRELRIHQHSPLQRRTLSRR